MKIITSKQLTGITRYFEIVAEINEFKIIATLIKEFDENSDSTNYEFEIISITPETKLSKKEVETLKKMAIGSITDANMNSLERLTNK